MQVTSLDPRVDMNALAAPPHPTIGHVSLYADAPQQAAAMLADVLGGRAAPFPPHPGGWVCFLAAERADWPHEFIEFYPRDTQLAPGAGGAPRPRFMPVEGGRATGAGSHVNLLVPMSASEVEAACARTGRPFGWRRPGLMDFWLEDRLMVELVPAG